MNFLGETMKIDTLNWTKVTLGDIAQSLTIAIKDPLSEGLERYVGLEHIEPGNVHIKSWGNVADGTTFTRVFRKGQVLFGKRRAYQKKAAMAEFDGICSGDILVCEAIKDAVVPELLPFIVQSDRFFEHAIKTSAGSLSPRTKFKDLAKFTFKLPEKPADQRRIADLLWSMDQYETKINNVAEILFKTEKTIFFEAIKILEEKYKPVRIGDISRPRQWPTIPTKNLTKQGFIVYGANGPIGYYNKYNHENRTIAITCRGATCGTVHLTPTKVYITGNAMCLDGIDDKSINIGFLFHSLRLRGFKKIISGSAQPQIIKEDLERVQIIVPSIKDQNEIVTKMNNISSLFQECRDQLYKTSLIKKQLINKIFG